MKNLNLQFEKAVRLLVENLPVSNLKTRKPVLFHAIRVGNYLYERNYTPEIILAGVLHDALEFSSIKKQKIKSNFGENVLKLIQACTKDDSITDPVAKTDDLIKRCTKAGKNALIVKTADTIDSFKYYSAEKNLDQLQYCQRNAEAIFKYKPARFQDPIFEELKNWSNGFKLASN